jgi:hypothetical protein
MHLPLQQSASFEQGEEVLLQHAAAKENISH